MKIILDRTDIEENENKVIQAITYVEARYGSAVIIGTRAALIKVGSPDSFFDEDKSSVPTFCGCKVEVRTNKFKPRPNDISYSDVTLYVVSSEACEQILDSELL